MKRLHATLVDIWQGLKNGLVDFLPPLLVVGAAGYLIYAILQAT